jgi:hypothetical protein
MKSINGVYRPQAAYASSRRFKTAYWKQLRPGSRDVRKGPRNYRYSRPKVKRFLNWNHYFADRTGTRKANETRRRAARMLSLSCIRTRR